MALTPWRWGPPASISALTSTRTPPPRTDSDALAARDKIPVGLGEASLHAYYVLGTVIFWPAGQLAGFHRQAGSLTSQLRKSELLPQQLAFPSLSMPLSPWILEVWWQQWSEWFSFISDVACLGTCHRHQVVTVYGCGYLNSLAICFNRHHIKLLK